MALSTQQQILVEQRVSNEAKSALVAYLLWFFLGPFGAHRFYLARGGSGAAMLILFIVGLATLVIFIGIPLVLGVLIWLLVDAFLIPGMVDQLRQGTRTRATHELLVIGQDEGPG
jgi:TM2 domain-containing membrane protein YozV